MRLVRSNDHPHPPPPLLRLHRIRDWRLDGVGGGWDYLDFLFGFRGGAVSVVGE